MTQANIQQPGSDLNPEILGGTIRRIRKSADVSQETLAKHLLLHQAAICRIELGEQNILPEQLWKVSKFFGVGVDDILFGTVNYWAVAERFKQAPPFPARYREHANSKVRELLPLLRFMTSVKGEAYSNGFLQQQKLDPVLFTCPDQQIGVNCNLDLARHAIAAGLITKKSFPALIDETRSSSTQGFLDRVYRAQDSGLKLVQTWVLNSTHYETNFLYQFEAFKKNQLELTVTPRAHMKQVQYRDETLGDYLCRYKRGLLSAFPRYINAKPLKITEKECHFHGAAKCVYKLTT